MSNIPYRTALIVGAGSGTIRLDECNYRPGWSVPQRA
jgi:hypothetical protein